MTLLLTYNISDSHASNRDTPVVRVVRKASDSVVNIHGHKTVRSGGYGGQGQSFQQVNGMGTGVIIDPRGYVITNFHVVQDVNDIRISMSDKRPAIARVVAHDLRTDLALLKIDTQKELPVIDLGSSKDLWPGESVVAIGNAYGYEHTVTTGIISALHRDVPVNEEQHYTDLIQTSAEINPGNSGGPLLNLDGQMIGINVAVRVGAQGIAFTIPVDQVLDIVSRLIKQKNATRIRHGIVGRTQWLSDEESNFLVSAVAKGSAADRQGVSSGDQIVGINGSPIRNHLDFELALLELNSRSPLELEVANSDGEVSLIALKSGSAGASTSSQVASTRRPQKTAPRMDSIAQRIWTTLGLQGTPVGEDVMETVNSTMDTTYTAGLRITNVRHDSQADRQGIQEGDILLGIRNWQTSSLNDLDYILRSEEFRSGQQSQFFIVRADKTMVGYLQMAQSTRRTSARTR